MAAEPVVGLMGGQPMVGPVLGQPVLGQPQQVLAVDAEMEVARTSEAHEVNSSSLSGKPLDARVFDRP